MDYLQFLWDNYPSFVTWCGTLLLTVVVLIGSLYEYGKDSNNVYGKAYKTICCGREPLNDTIELLDNGIYIGICSQCHEGSELEWDMKKLEKSGSDDTHTVSHST